MIDCIEIEANPWQNEIEIGEATALDLTVESGFDIELEAEPSDGSEIHLVIADIVDESEADNTAYDFIQMHGFQAKHGNKIIQRVWQRK